MAVLDKGKWYPNKDVHELSSEDSFHLPEIPEVGRYHLYMSLACPFAHRPYLVINYLGLKHAISVSSVAAKRYSDGWLFDEDNPDEINGIIRDTYNSAKLERGFNLDQGSGIFFNRTPKILGQDEKTLLSAFERPTEGGKKYFQEGLVKNLDEGKNLSQIDDIVLPDGSIFERKRLLKELVGKSNDGLNTAITGTNRLANLVIRSEVNQEIILNSARQKKLVDEWLTSVDEIIVNLIIYRISILS